MFPFRKKKEETYTIGSSARLSRSEVEKILRTVPRDKAFYFYEGVGKPTGQVATGLVDFRDKINDVKLSSLVFHLKRKDFENWIKDIIGDSELAKRISNVDPYAFDLKIKLYAAVSKRINELKEVLSTSIVVSEDLLVTPRFSETELPR